MWFPQSEKILSKLYSKNTKYNHLFISIIVIFVLSPLARYYTVANNIFSFSFFSVVIFSINTLSFSSRMIFICRVIAAIAFVADLIDIKNNPQLSEILSIIGNLCFGLFILISIVAITTRVVEEKKVNLDVIKGAICIYFMLGILWFSLYYTIFLFDENAFSFPDTSLNRIRSQLFYFSFTTLTTLGYGDITPFNAFAMMLANGEALMGQLFPAIFLAKLVSSYQKD